jgi:HAD superfamily hydrolase (TIGR01509 family)
MASGANPAPVLALIFDLDGVIVHSTPIHNEAWRRYLGLHGLHIDGIQARMLGKHNDEIVRDFFGSGVSREELRQHGSAKERLYRDLMKPCLERHLVQGVVPFLERFAGTPMAVASNAEAANIEFVLERARLRGWFRQVIDGSQVERPKPDPEIYLRAASLLGVEPSRCVVFEDSPVGVAAAKSAGARVVGVRTTVRELNGVDYSVDDFTSAGLVAWLSRCMAPR